MAIRGQSLTLTFVDWDTVNNVGKTGDASNITLRWVKDGTSAAPDGSPSITEVDSTNAPGVYKVTLDATDCTANFGTLCGKSSSSGCAIIPISIPFENIAIRVNTAQGGSVNHITLDSSASSTNSFYNGLRVYIASGTGAGQSRAIIAYNGTTKAAIPDRVFITAPDNTSVFYLMEADDAAVNAYSQIAAATPQTVLHTGTAQAGSTTTITLDTGASGVNSVYNGNTISITGGTGVGQSAIISGYVGSTNVATIYGTWATAPDSTSTFSILAPNSLSTFSQVGLAAAGGSTSITFDSGAVATTSYYVGCLVTILSGTGSGQTREITAYSNSRVATVDAAWSVNPDTTSVYAIIPAAVNNPTIAAPSLLQIITGVWQNVSLGAIDTIVLDSVNGIETGVTPRQAIRQIGAAVAGKLTQTGSSAPYTVTVIGLDNATIRTVYTVDASGQRSAATRTL